MQSPTFITTLSHDSSELPKHRESELGFPDTKYVVSLATISNSSKQPMGVQQGGLILTGNPGS